MFVGHWGKKKKEKIERGKKNHYTATEKLFKPEML